MAYHRTVCIRYSTIDECWERWIRRKNIWVPLPPPKPKEAALFPGSSGLIIRSEHEHGRELIEATWGLQPHWAKRATFGKSYGYNARQEGSEDRSEGIENMPLFRESFRTRRCLVPAAAFFERVGPKGSQRWMKISPTDGHEEPLIMLGLWSPPNEWTELPTFTIVTTEPPEGYIHDRIPVLTEYDAGQAWMANNAPIEGLKALTHRALSDHLRVEEFGPVEYKPKQDRAQKPIKGKITQEELF